MDEKFVSFLAFESATTRLERTIKRLWIIVIILILSLLATNGAWIYYESQWETVQTTVTQEATADGESDIQLIGGDYSGGQSETDNQD